LEINIIYKQVRLKKYIVFYGLVMLALSSSAQTEHHFFVQFHDKMLNYTKLNQPRSFLSERSLQRRERQGIKIDSFDLPVTKAYVDNIVSPAVSLRYVSKWLNGAVVSVQELDSAYRLKIKFFVDDVVYLGKSEAPAKDGKSGTKQIGPLQDFNESEYASSTDEAKRLYNMSFKQVDMIHGIDVHQAGYRGEGMYVAVFDAGFYRVDELSAFKSLFEDNRLLATFDIQSGDEKVYEDNDHGMNVLGVMAANSPNNIIGTAPAASYVLFRTESKKFESQLEELNWVRAAEMADSLGVDVINSSLGYNTFDDKRLDHTHEELDGKSTYVSRGAAISATRGMLVVNASGNDGNKMWKKINFPADAKDILTVGAVDLSLEPPSFSSFGPTADYRIKPEISALGYQTNITTTYGVGKANGTSFSCPVIAGMMACLWQSDRTKTPGELISVISRCGHLYNDPDNVLGYGVPDFNLALTILGQNREFDYSSTGSVYAIPDTILSGVWIDFHIFQKDRAYYELTENKRFIFIPYRSKLARQSITIPSDGFVKLTTSHHQKGRLKEVDLSIYSVSKKGKKRGRPIFSVHRKLLKS
jgi:serine protease AprX